jgi:hypothetical protein
VDFVIQYSEQNTMFWKLDLFLSSGKKMEEVPIQLGPVGRDRFSYWTVLKSSYFYLTPESSNAKCNIPSRKPLTNNKNVIT